MVLVAMGTTRVRMQVKVMTAGSRMVEMQHECLRRDKIKKIKIEQKNKPKIKGGIVLGQWHLWNISECFILNIWSTLESFRSGFCTHSIYYTG